MNLEVTHDNLPQAVSILSKQVANLEKLLTNKDITQPPTEHLLNIEECAQFLNLSKATIYSKTSTGELPFMKRSKRLYFSSIELMDYVKKGRNKTNSEIEAAAEQYLTK